MIGIKINTDVSFTNITIAESNNHKSNHKSFCIISNNKNLRTDFFNSSQS